jgi:hypothetical protein
VAPLNVSTFNDQTINFLPYIGRRGTALLP